MLREVPFCAVPGQDGWAEGGEREQDRGTNPNSGRRLKKEEKRFSIYVIC